MNYAVKEMYKNELMEYVVHEEDKGARQTNFVCLKNDGLNCDYNQIKLLIRYLQRNVNKQFDVHSLRHTHATMLIENGVPVKTVQERLGHENIETTLNTYVHNTDSMNKIAVDTISQIVSKNNIV